ncbi:tetratricopeptide repeat protein [Sinorhizobium meliloti]|uniref:tetratricopeptide repeat protein n=1 Tax=Rhizobium meliloti TaxID=382 RepID=UPI000B4A079E|nr:tetratricopeptide repeat protein [Sinorhizobium meliloti]ASP55461.1 tetratricopeptide repeat-containing protein [Sinorhizobium meliloti]
MRWLSGLFGRGVPAIAGAGVLFEAEPASRDLVIVFSSRNRTNFEMQTVLRDLRINKLHIKDRTGQSWFHDGVEGISCDLQSTADALSSFVKGGRFKRVTCIGASMGGYAALLFGALLKVDRAVAFSPQIVFHERWPYTPSPDVPVRDFVLPGLVGAASRTQFHIISSSELHDVYQASLIAKHKNVRVDVIEWDHNTLRKVKTAMSISKFITGLIARERHAAKRHDVSHVIGNMPSGDVFQVLDLFYRGKHNKCIEMCRYLMLRNDRSCELNLILGQCLYFTKRYDQALPHLKRAYKIDSYCLRTFPFLICTLLALRLEDRAVELYYEYRGALKNRRNDPTGPVARLSEMAKPLGAEDFCSLIADDIDPHSKHASAADTGIGDPQHAAYPGAL